MRDTARLFMGGGLAVDKYLKKRDGICTSTKKSTQQRKNRKKLATSAKNARLDIKINLPLRYRHQRILQAQPWFRRLSLQPNLMEAFSADASAEVGMQLSVLIVSFSWFGAMIISCDASMFGRKLV